MTMTYQEWQKRSEAASAESSAVYGMRDYIISDRITVSVQPVDGAGFFVNIWRTTYGQSDNCNLALLTPAEFMTMRDIVWQWRAWVNGDGDYPDPKTWRAPKTWRVT